MKQSFFRTPIIVKVGLISLILGLGTIVFPVVAQVSRSQLQPFTVKIIRPGAIGESGGSGVLVRHEGNRYTVLTNCHVLKVRGEPFPGEYQVQLSDGRSYPVSVPNPQSRCHPRGIDLATIDFESNQTYAIPVQRSETNLDNLLNDSKLYLAGFNNPYTESSTNVTQQRQFQVIEGNWYTRRENVSDGYDLTHSAQALNGMSGGPIFDSEGRVVAIHGETVTVSSSVTRFSAIPIHYYTNWGVAGGTPDTPVTSRVPPTPQPIRTPRPTPQTPPPRTSTYLGIAVEPYSYTSARVSASGAVTPYNANAPIGKYTETALRLPANAVSLDMVAIPGGTFTMGSPDTEADRDSDEGPRHQVTVPDFFMGRYEVSQAQYEAVMGTNPAYFKGANNPVEVVSWDNAREFCRRLSQLTGRTYRLPTEAEWEYAARAGTTTPFSYGESITPTVVNYNGNYPYGNAPRGEYRETTIAVNTLYPNAWGLYHIHGNVWEWVQDQYHDSYSKKPSSLVGDGSTPWTTNTNVLPGNDLRVLRGGSWFFIAWLSRSAYRAGFSSDYRNYGNGFRVVLVR